MTDREIWRVEISELSDKDLLDELSRPTRDWEQDVIRESLKRILKKLTEKEKLI